MSTLQEMLSRAEKEKSSTYDEVTKTDWINYVNQKVSNEILKQAELPVLSYPADSQTALLVPAPYDVMYLYYVYAQIDMLSMDIESYNNYVSAYNDAFDDYRRYYIRNNLPKARYITGL